MAARCRTGLGQQFDAKLDLDVKCGFEKLEGGFSQRSLPSQLTDATTAGAARAPQG